MAKEIYLIDKMIEGQRYILPEIEEITLGRQGLIKIPCASEMCKNVSRVHCRLFRKDLEGELGEYSLAVIDGNSDRDNKSKNGTYVDGEKISNETEMPLKDKSLLSLGGYELRVMIVNSETI